MARAPRRKSTRKAARRKSPPAAAKKVVRGYGWVPDLPDQRDFLYRAIRVVPPVLPHQVDLRPSCSPVENQGNLGSCTANALVGALEFLENKNKKPFADLSRLFVYYNERVIEHTVKTDSGAMLRDGIKTLAKQGVCKEKTWPYIVSKFAVKPAAKCYKEAALHTITSYHRILTQDEMLECLADGYPFVFGFTVYESFGHPRWHKVDWCRCRSRENGSWADMPSSPWGMMMPRRDSSSAIHGGRTGAWAAISRCHSNTSRTGTCRTISGRSVQAKIFRSANESPAVTR